MDQNIVAALFNVESEAYQALGELKQLPSDEKYVISQAVLAKKEGGAIKALDSFDTGLTTLNDTAMGGLLGACIGIIGGPIGMLLAGGYGALVGATLDTADAIGQASLIEMVAGKMEDGDCVVIVLTGEDDEAVLDAEFGKFDTVVARFDAAVVAQEVAEACTMQEEMARQARAEFRKEKTDEFKAKVAEHRETLKAIQDAMKK